MTVAAGTHELVLAMGETPLWVRRIAVGAQDVSIEIDVELEKALAVTPSGVFLRHGATFSRDMGQRLATLANVDHVWLLEKPNARTAEAVVRTFRAADGEEARSTIRWRDSKAGAANEIPIDLLGTAGNVAATRQAPLAMRSYEVKSPSPSEFVFVPYNGDWHAPSPWYKKWWVWTIAGGVATAATIAAVAVAARDDGRTALRPTVVLP